MPFQATGIPDLKIFEPRIFTDNRGYFFESFNEHSFLTEGISQHWVQDNQSRSTYGVVRGLHFQLEPYAQAKLVRVLHGSILDVVVDLRQGSPGFGKVFAVEISAENKLQLFVPRGFAHGFSVLSETVEVFYKCDQYYNKESESGIMWNDPELAIDWKIPADQVIISEKDRSQKSFSACKSLFSYGR